MRTGKFLIFALVFVGVLAIPILAANTASFTEIVFLGKGVAVNPSNSQDLHIVKAGVAQLTVSLSGASSDVSLGVLFFDDSKYVLKDLTIGDGTTSGNIYNGTSMIGSFSLNLVSKPSDDIWSGTLTLSGQNYNAYILAAHRNYTASEEGASVSDYCKNHATDQNCRGKVEDFCTSNPQDQRCQSLLHNYCKSHLSDGRCREELKKYCRNNTSESNCSEFCTKYPKVCNPSTTSSTTTTFTTSTAISITTSSSGMTTTSSTTSSTTTSLVQTTSTSTTTSTSISSTTTTAG
jgi:hypothetical protein